MMPIHHVTVGDARLAVHTSGSGRPLVLLHAFPLDHEMWRRQAELDESLRLIVPDLRGFGGSAGTVPTSIAELADDVAGILDALHVAEPAVVCGVSMGGYVAQHVAARHPDRVAALVLVDTKLEADSPEARAARTDLAGKVGRVGQAILADAMIPRLFAVPATTASAAAKARHAENLAAVDAMIRRQRVETIQAALAALGERPDMIEAMQRVGVPTRATSCPWRRRRSSTARCSSFWQTCREREDVVLRVGIEPMHAFFGVPVWKNMPTFARVIELTGFVLL
jgi:pimeloyl-ACP methyl ester carboxylesterase